MEVVVLANLVARDVRMTVTGMCKLALCEGGDWHGPLDLQPQGCESSDGGEAV